MRQDGGSVSKEIGMKATFAAVLAASAVLAGCVATYDRPPPPYRGSGYGYGHGDRDRDRDGVPDRRDRDRDGDGVPNRYDRRPDDSRRY